MALAAADTFGFETLPSSVGNSLPAHRTDGAGATRRGGRHGLAHAEPTDAAVGIPKGRVAPVHGPETRIGLGDPRAVSDGMSGPSPARIRWPKGFPTPQGPSNAATQLPQSRSIASSVVPIDQFPRQAAPPLCHSTRRPLFRGADS